MIGAAVLTGGALLLFLGLHPFTTYPFSLRILRKWYSVFTIEAPFAGSVAFCVCAYNEETVIRAKIENMLSFRRSYPNLDLLIYVDAASDGTAVIAQTFADQVRVVVSDARLGKTHGMNTLVGMTDADCLVFSDANVIFAPDALIRLLSPFADPEVGCVCGHLIYLTPVGNVTAKTGSLYWRLEEQIKQDESMTGSMVSADGSIFAVRRSLHVAPPPDLIDDMYVSMKVLCQGRRIVRVADAYAYEEAVSRPGEEFRRKIRIACQAFNVHRALWPELRLGRPLDVYKYVSHKLLRWFTIYLLSVSALLILAGTALVFGPVLFFTLLSLGVAGGLAIALLPVGLARTGRDVLSAFLATGIGVWQSILGKRFQTWSPPASTRSASNAIRSRAKG